MAPGTRRGMDLDCEQGLCAPAASTPKVHSTCYSGKMVYWMYQMYSTTGIQKW